MNSEKRDTFYVYPNVPSPSTPLVFDKEICNGCNYCAEVCQMDILIPHPVKGEPPIVIFPDECW